MASVIVPKLAILGKRSLPTPCRPQALRAHLRCWIENNGPQHVDGLVEVMQLEGILTKEDTMSVLQFYISRGSLFRLWPHFSRAVDRKIDFLSHQQVFRDGISLFARHGYVDHVLVVLARSREQLTDLMMAWTIVELVKLLPPETGVRMPTPGAFKRLLAAAAEHDIAVAADYADLNQFRPVPTPMPADIPVKWTPDRLLILTLQLRQWFPENLDRSDLDNAVLFAMSRFGRLDLMMEYLFIMMPNSDSYFLIIKLLGNLGTSGHALQRLIFEKLDGRTNRKISTAMSLYSLIFQAAVGTNDFPGARKMRKRLQDLLKDNQNKWRTTFFEEDSSLALKAREVLLPPSARQKAKKTQPKRPDGFEFQLRLFLDSSRRYSIDYFDSIPPYFGRPVGFPSLDSCLDIFRLMQANKAQPSPKTFELLIEACMLHDCVDTARELWQVMRFLCVKPSTETCIVMATGLLRYGHVLDAIQLISAMQSERIALTINFRRAFLRTLVHTQRHYVFRDHYAIWTELYFPGVRRVGASLRADQAAGLLMPQPTALTDRHLVRRELRCFLRIVDKLRDDIRANLLLPTSRFISQPWKNLTA